MAARILLAVAAGLYVPNANALAGALVAPSRRGTALSIVTGGTSVAVALGVPLGALVGDRFGWRLNFAAVGALALIATAGLLSGLPRDIADRLPVASSPRAPRRGASARGSPGSAQHHALGDGRLRRLHLPRVIPHARRRNRGIVRQRRAVHVGRRGRDRSQAWAGV